MLYQLLFQLTEAIDGPDQVAMGANMLHLIRDNYPNLSPEDIELVASQLESMAVIGLVDRFKESLMLFDRVFDLGLSGMWEIKRAERRRGDGAGEGEAESGTAEILPGGQGAEGGVPGGDEAFCRGIGDESLSLGPNESRMYQRRLRELVGMFDDPSLDLDRWISVDLRLHERALAIFERQLEAARGDTRVARGGG